jgi:hypothetical protein
MSSSQQPPPDDNVTGTASNQTTYSDTSGRIFNFYTICAEKMDQENVENWKDGANTILVFVRFHAPLTVTTVVCLQVLSRSAFSLLPWLPLSPSATRACSKIPTSSHSPSSHRYPNNFPVQMPTAPFPPQLRLLKVPSPPLLRWYLSTLSGSSVSCSASPALSWPHFYNNGLADTSR